MPTFISQHVGDFADAGVHLTDSDIGKQFQTRGGKIVTLERTSYDSAIDCVEIHPYCYRIGRAVVPVRVDGGWRFLGDGQDELDIVARVEERVVLSPANPPHHDLVLRRNCIPLTPPSLIDSVKESNPKDAVGIRKIPMSCISMPVMMEIAAGMMEGARKYGRHNYRVIGVRASVYFDAAMRHLTAWWEGEDIDEASGLSHISKAMSTLHVLRDAMIRDKMVDDRPPGTSGFIAALNDVAADICDRFPDAKEPFLAQGPPDKYVA